MSPTSHLNEAARRYVGEEGQRDIAFLAFVAIVRVQDINGRTHQCTRCTSAPSMSPPNVPAHATLAHQRDMMTARWPQPHVANA
jgi:hypothetical protein